VSLLLGHCQFSLKYQRPSKGIDDRKDLFAFLLSVHCDLNG